MVMRSNKSFFGSLLISLGFLTSGTDAQAQDTRVIQLARLEIDSSQLESYSRLLKEGVETALKLEPGVLTLFAVVDKGHPTHITILEIYADTTAYRAHLQTPHFLKYKSATAAMVKRLELVPVTPLVTDMRIK
jgi:4-carboxymuconolactone decarboxylase